MMALGGEACLLDYSLYSGAGTRGPLREAVLFVTTRASGTAGAYGCSDGSFALHVRAR